MIYSNSLTYMDGASEVQWGNMTDQIIRFWLLLAGVTEKAMAPHSSTLAWKIPWTEKPGGLQSMGSRGVRHDWATSLSLFTFMHWRRQWQPTPVFLPGESQGQGSLVGCCLWGGTVGHDWSDLAAAAAGVKVEILPLYNKSGVAVSDFSQHHLQRLEVAGNVEHLLLYPLRHYCFLFHLVVALLLLQSRA